VRGDIVAIKLLIADDDILIRESLKMIIEMDEEFEVVACVENGLKAVEFCRTNKVDVAMLDIQMPVMDGVGAVKEISKNTDVKTLILTTFDDDEYISEAIGYGAKGYLLKNNAPDKIKEAIRVVYNGSTIMQDVVMDKFKDSFMNNTNKREDKIDKSLFSERELQIMELISKGRSNKEISGELYISEGTVKNYISNVLSKTGLDHRTQIAIYYINGGRL
jgi:DNA-binding NarL/FixJ family response regulator